MANERRNAHAQTFRIPESNLEVVTIYMWPPMRPGDEIRFSATYPSRPLVPVTSDLLQQYAAAWAEAAQWMAGMQMPLIVDAAQEPGRILKNAN